MHLECLPRQKPLKRLAEATDDRLVRRIRLVFEDVGELAYERLNLAAPAIALHKRLFKRIREFALRQLVDDLAQFVRKFHLRIERLLYGLARRIGHVPAELAVLRRDRRCKLVSSELVYRLERGVCIVGSGVQRLAVALGEVHLAEGGLQRDRVDPLRRALRRARKEHVELAEKRTRLLHAVVNLLKRNVLAFISAACHARGLLYADRLVERDADVLAWLLNRGKRWPHAFNRTEICMSAHWFSSSFPCRADLSAVALAKAEALAEADALYTRHAAKGYNDLNRDKLSNFTY